MASCWPDGMVVLCAANGYDEPGVTDRHMAEHLSRLVPVLYVDPPASWLRRRRAPGASRLRMISGSLARLTPSVLPFPSRQGMTGVTSAILRHCLRRATGRLGGQVSAVVTAWPHFPVLGACGEEVSVYWAQDDYPGGAELLGLDAAMLARRERKTAAAADLVVVVSPVLRDSWAGRGHRTVLVPNGADLAGLKSVDSAPVPDDVRLPSPVAGVIGRLNGRADLALLEAVADRGRSLLLVGPADAELGSSRRFRRLAGRRTVRWTGGRPGQRHPGATCGSSTSAWCRTRTPRSTGDRSRSRRWSTSPRAGAAVSTPMPSTRWLGTDLITMASGPDAFADAVDKALDEPRTPELVRARREFAARHSWPRRAAEMRAAIMAARQRKLPPAGRP